MTTPEQDVQNGRDRRTKLLLAGGAVSLVLPLLGVVYIRMNEAKTARAPDSSVTFERREAGESKVNVSQTVTIMNPLASTPAPGLSSLPVAGGETMTTAPGGSSLDFIKGGTFPEKSSAPAAAAAPAAPPAPVAESKPIESKPTAQKGGKKAFAMPKLQGTKGFSSFKGGSPRPTGGKGMTGAVTPEAAGDGDMADMLKKIPGGADNPEVKKFLQNQGK